VAGPTNVQAVDVDVATRNLDRAIAAAFEHARSSPQTVAAAVLAIAGSDRDAARQIFASWAEERRLAKRFRVVNDALPVLAEGSPEGWGIALICGTGSFCFGKSRDGRSTRAGGWGYLFGDEGSGYCMAVAGLRAAAKMADLRGQATELLPAFLSHLNLDDPFMLIPTIYRMANDRAAIAALAEVVVMAAGKQDDVAEQIVEEAAGELATMIETVARKLGFPSTAFPLALAGSLLIGTQVLKSRLQTRLESRGLHPDPLATVKEPVSGAVKLCLADAIE
jgi:N-acetylglucosamine kinase-like BadF-type ATPase